MKNTDFKSEKVSKTATIILSGNISTVFPLFGAFEERKWMNHIKKTSKDAGDIEIFKNQ